MDFDLKSLRCFLALADELNFSRAAARVNLTQPAFSSQIRGLEQRLGFSLFERTTRQVGLTRQGERLVPAARRLLADAATLQERVAEMRGGRTRRLAFGAAFYTLDIPERVRLIEAFQAEQAGAPFEVTTAWQHELVPQLDQGRIDMALLIGAPVPRADYVRERATRPMLETAFPEDLPRLVLRREPVRLLIPAESPLAWRRTLPREALDGVRVAVLGDSHGEAVNGPIRRLLDMAGAQAVAPPESHAIAVERYGRQFRMPAISLGWFGAPEAGGDMVRREIAGFEHATELALVHGPLGLSAEAQGLWRQAQDIFDTAS
ncbi:LysR family transcriptional regulator [Phenylobacterium sp.]|uniref:LysR family transcriptional regulator n=1 Tax=Phenylobacterium sp. TaxID=1871053 RepID=UPI0035AFF710